MNSPQLSLFAGHTSEPEGPEVWLAGRDRVPVVIVRIASVYEDPNTLLVTVEEVHTGKRWAMNDHALILRRR